jgi:hypothetical protein
MKNKTASKKFLANFIRPEVNIENATLQPQEFNPLERIGPLPTTQYSTFNRPYDLMQ